VNKIYLDGKITLKEPTLEGLCDFGGLCKIYDYSEIVAGKGLLELLPIICEFQEGFEWKKMNNQKVITEILKDFFTSWSPTKWISDNIGVLGQSLKLLQESQTPKDSKKP